MSLFQFNAVIDGWNQAHGEGKPDGPSDAEFDAMLEQHAAGRARALH
ncbi:hypothetical protein V5F77_20480 [Xanthobacter sp. DSM 24535]